MASGLVLVACSGNSPDDVATLEQPTSPTASLTQADAARALVKCMDRAGIKMELIEAEDDQAWAGPMGYSSFGTRDPDGLPGFVGVETASYADWQRLDQQLRQIGQARPGSWILLIDGQDYSEAYDACIKESGYTEPGFQMDPVEDARNRQLNAEAGAAWAACAREHGYPNVDDPVPGKPGDDDYPTIVLSFSMTDQALKALIAECPTFDRQIQEEYDKASEDPNFDPDGSKYPRWPSIDFDYVWPEDPNDASQAEIDRLNALVGITTAEQDAYRGSRLEGDGPATMFLGGG